MRKYRNLPDENIKGFSWQAIKLLSPYLIEHKARVGLALFCLVLAKVASVGLPFILKHIVDDLEQMNDAVAIALSVPIALVVAYGSVRFFNVILGEIRDTLFGRVTERAMRRVGLKLFQHLHTLDLDFHLNRQTGGLSRDMERGTTGISFLMRFMVFNIVPILLEILFVTAIFFTQYGIEFAAITLLSVFAYIFFTAIATEWRTKFVREANVADSTSNSRAIDSLLNYETVKYFNNEKFESNRYDVELAAWEQARRKNRLTLFGLNGGQALIISVAMTLMLLLAANGVVEKNMTLGDFVLINAFMMQLFMPLNFLGFVYREIKGSLANIEKMFELIGRVPKILDQDKCAELKVEKGELSFEQVSFSYNPERSILNEVDLVVGAGQKLAIVGESGSGKSTMVKLLFRFYDPNKGRVLIDGQDIKQVSQDSLRKAIGIVPQDTVLFNDNIFENVRYGKPEASDEQVWQAIKHAHLSDFIAKLPEKEKTQVGERGLKLSGGEKQRVAIARTILKNPPILVFDEATSSLDSGSEQAILSALREVAVGHTSLVIAHRLSTIIDADQIVVMADGQIVEAGTHQELLDKGGKYAKMWIMQQESNE